jgi:hypothetical protein
MVYRRHYEDFFNNCEDFRMLAIKGVFAEVLSLAQSSFVYFRDVQQKSGTDDLSVARCKTSGQRMDNRIGAAKPRNPHHFFPKKKEFCAKKIYRGFAAPTLSSFSYPDVLHRATKISSVPDFVTHR